MASAAERGVEHDTVGNRAEHVRDLLGHHREVNEWFGHRTPS
jgi:hypothetical protein